MTKTTKTVLWIVGIVVVILIVVMVSRGGSNNTGPIKIGFIGPLTGSASSIGQNAQSAVEVAVDQVNSAGGINGRPLQVIYEDGQCSGAPSSSAASKLINVDKVSAILGGACSGETMAFTQIAEQANMPVLSYCSSNPAITNAGDYIFRDYPSDNYQGTYAANYLYNTLGKKKVAIFYSKTDWANGIKQVFTGAFTKLGGQIVADEGFSQNSTDVRTSVAKIKAANPDAIYFLGYTAETLVALKQSQEGGLKVSTWLGGDAWDDPKLWPAVGPYGEGMKYVVISSNPTNAFKVAMAQKVGSGEIDTCSPPAYDGLKILAQVMAKVGTDPVAIKTALYSVDYTGGVSASDIQFDQNGDLKTANYTVNVIHNGVASSTTQ
jgi:branched-chain amino acid transport system substrate-binding protein